MVFIFLFTDNFMLIKKRSKDFKLKEMKIGYFLLIILHL